MANPRKAIPSGARLLGLTAALTLAGAAPALADTIGITTTADPVEDVTYQIEVTGTAHEDDHVYVTIKPTGGQPCADNYDADDGDAVPSVWSPFGWVDHTGSFDFEDNYTPSDSGTYLLCAWVGDSDYAEARGQRVITVRQPASSVSIAPLPAVRPGRTVQVALTAQTEVDRYLYVDLNEPGVPCGANFEANQAQDTVVDGQENQGGPRRYVTNWTAPDSAGTYLLCGYVQEESDDTVPEGVFGGSLTVAVPPRPTGKARISLPRRLKVSRRLRTAHLRVRCRNIRADRCKLRLQLRYRHKRVARVRGTISGGRSHSFRLRFHRKALRRMAGHRLHVTGTSANRRGALVKVKRAVSVKVAHR